MVNLNRTIFLLLFLTVACFSKAFAQSDSLALSNADTTQFSVNTVGGWKLYNSYIEAGAGDSVRIELILRKDFTTAWADQQLVGKIKNSDLRPETNRVINAWLIESEFEFRIDSDGNCYLRLLSGPAPQNSPAVIPLAGYYIK